MNDMWERIKSVDIYGKFSFSGAVDIFFEKFFVECPEVKPLFGNFNRRCNVFAHVFSHVINKSKDINCNEYRESLKALGKKHQGFDIGFLVNKDTFVGMGKAMLELVEHRSTPPFSDDKK
eukprot:Pgem_evm1s3451